VSPADLVPLEAVAREVAAEWGVELGERFALARYSYVATAGDDAVLKVTPPEDDESDEEAEALELWADALVAYRHALGADPDDADACVSAIGALFADAPRRERIARQAGEDATAYTWEARAARIQAFLCDLRVRNAAERRGVLELAPSSIPPRSP